MALIRRVSHPEIENKIEKKHGVFFEEILEVFICDKPYYKGTRDNKYILYGKTEEGRYLLVVFMPKNGKIRLITSRDMNSSEKHSYRKYEG